MDFCACTFLNTIYPNRQNWEMIMSKTFFLGQFTVENYLKPFLFLLADIEGPMFLVAAFG